MDQTTTPAADQPTEQATAQTPAPVAETPTPAADLPAATEVHLADTAPEPESVDAPPVLNERARQLMRDLREVASEAERTPNLGALLGRLATLLADVMEEVDQSLNELRG